MKIAEAADRTESMIRGMKQEAVRKAKGPVDLQTVVACYRGDEPVAVIFQTPDRDHMLHTMTIAATGFSADVVAIAFESYMVTGDEESTKDPRTGEWWAQGAMQSYVDEFGLGGPVGEGIGIQVMNRAGDLTSRWLPFEVDGREVRWLPDAVPPEMELSGIIPEAFAEIMMRRSLDQIVPAEAYALVNNDSQRARFHMDMGTALAIKEAVKVDAEVMLYAERGTPREQLFRTRFDRRDIFDSKRWN